MLEDINFFLKGYYYQIIFKLIYCLPLFFILILIDWISKGIIASLMYIENIQKIIPGFIYFQYFVNTGAAYGINANNISLSIFLASFGVIILSFMMIFCQNKFLIISVTFMFGGSFANLFGRIWGPNNGVIDFMVWDFGRNLGILTNYVFNFADLFVNIGVILVIGFLFYYLINSLILYRLKIKDFELYEIKILEKETMKTEYQICEFKILKIFFSKIKYHEKKIAINNEIEIRNNKIINSQNK